MTPLPADLARPLVDSLVNEVVVRDHSIDDVVDHHPIGCREAIELALRRVGELDVATRWTDAELFGRSPADPMPTDPDWSGATVLVDRQVVETTATPAALYGVINALGGEQGWLVGGWLWTIRGWLDLLVGGVGMRRGRRHPTELRVGDVAGFWRVEALEPAKLVRLRAEMRLPGDAWIEWSIAPGPQGGSLVQRALFRPRGLLGRVYWYCVAPFHRFIFCPLAHRIAQEATRWNGASPRGSARPITPTPGA